jgi:MinD-like ATPase involved in chromosome partitioning or flagellar assembly
VWGPTGAPGRTSLAIGLAAELARLGHRTLLVDADTYGASIAQSLSLVDDTTGLGTAVQELDRGTLDDTGLRDLTQEVLPGLWVLPGIPRPSHWSALTPTGLGALWPLTRRLAAWTVVDCGFLLEPRENGTDTTATSRRGAATLSPLREADLVLAVGQANPVGLHRLVRGLSELRALLPVDRRVRVVVNRVRPSAVGSSPERRVTRALRQFAGVHDPVLVPDDPAAHDRALLRGVPLAQVATDSPARRAVQSLAGCLSGGTPAEHAVGTPARPQTRPLATRSRGPRRRWAGAGRSRHEFLVRRVR